MTRSLLTALKRQHEPQRFAGDLLKAEVFEKQARSIKYQLTIAKLPLAKDVDGFEFKGTPINESLVRDLTGGELYRATAQRRPGRRDRHRQDASGDGDCAQLYPRRVARPVLQHRRSGQPARGRGTGRPARGGSPIISPASTSSSWMNLATCHSHRLADSFCSIWSAASTSGPR